MKVYNKITKELFGFISFEKPTWKYFKGEVKFSVVKYCYVFPQKMNTWDCYNRKEVMYYFLFFRIQIFNYKR